MAEPTMLKAVFQGGDKIEVASAPIPEPGEGEVLLKTSYCGLCGSDKRLFHNGTQNTPGHELTGVVVKNGPGAGAPEGARVAVYIHHYCGQCRFCRVGETNRCINVLGGQVGFNRPGGYAQYLTVPASCLIDLPPDISDAEGVLILDTIGTATYGVRYGQQTLDSQARSGKAAVVGLGPLGLGSFHILSSLGMEGHLYVYDPAPVRMEAALAWGAKAIGPANLSTQGEFTMVVEASGQQAGRDLVLDLVEPGGCVVLFGQSPNPWTIQPHIKWRRKDFSIVHSFYFPIGMAAEFMDLFRARAGFYRQMISPIVPLEKMQDAFIDFCAGKTLKPLVKLNSESSEIGS
jgi:threonine dehydrogenase-like Zn-dependent dehydrogenase